jgi:hypothetical protein
VTPGSKRKVVADAKDLKPRNVKDLRCTGLQAQVTTVRPNGRGHSSERRPLNRCHTNQENLPSRRGQRRMDAREVAG